MSEVEALLAALGDARKAVQRPAAEALAAHARRSPEVRSRVAALLASEEPRRRWGAAYALAAAEASPADAVPALLEALASPDGDLRWASARIVVRMTRAMPALREALRALAGGADAGGRKMALYCLRDVAVREAASDAAATAALADGDPAVRLAALAALPAVTPDAAAAARRATALLADGDGGVRRAAAVCLGLLAADGAEVRAALGRAAASADAALARAARGALSRLDGATSRRS
jgi:hypothetical protein